MAALETIISSGLSFVVGCVLTKLSSNSSNDNQCRSENIKTIDLIVDQFNIYLNSTDDKIIQNATWLDYQIRSLVDDTTLLPIIGRSAFDGEYTKIIGNMFAITERTPKNLNQIEKDVLSKKMNSYAINLKKMINTGRGSIRIWSKR